MNFMVPVGRTASELAHMVHAVQKMEIGTYLPNRELRLLSNNQQAGGHLPIAIQAANKVMGVAAVLVEALQAKNAQPANAALQVTFGMHPISETAALNDG